MSLSRKQPAEKYNFPDAKRLWHAEGEKTRSLGCMTCSFKGDCGGLSVSAGFYDCNSLCRCTDPSRCTKVCPNNKTQLIRSMKEVKGLNLATVPRVAALNDVSLPLSVPMLYHASKRAGLFGAPVVALSLFLMLDKKSGQLKYGSPQALRSAFKLAPEAHVILSGTHTDPSLERVWGLADRKAFLRSLAGLGIDLLTTPNYSLFCDNPRLDDLHSMKRIAITYSEALQAGLATALHVNARTEHDYERWAQFVGEREEIQWLCLEFGTGAGRQSRIDFHIRQINAVAQYVSRPLRLIIRGGAGELPNLLPNFERITVIDTSAFVKTQRRQRAAIVQGKLRWESSPTTKDEFLDSLLAHNVNTVAESINLAQ